MQVAYGFLWNERRRELVDPISEEQARKQLETGGEPFEVVLGDPGRPTVTVNVVPEDRSYVTCFYDEHGRRWLSYGFVPASDGQRLFVKNVSRWEWDDPRRMEPDEASVIESYSYREDGRVKHEKRYPGTRTKDVEEIRDVALDINWEPFPAFGDWASIARFNREQTTTHPANRIP